MALVVAIWKNGDVTILEMDQKYCPGDVVYGLNDEANAAQVAAVFECIPDEDGLHITIGNTNERVEGFDSGHIPIGSIAGRVLRLQGIPEVVIEDSDNELPSWE